ncbi:hypothetical protein [Pseudoflavonifractor sp. MCC625]|nr:hypothetical protein [Pseudoflavonifractor sp. MCC625]
MTIARHVPPHWLFLALFHNSGNHRNHNNRDDYHNNDSSVHGNTSLH